MTDQQFVIDLEGDQRGIVEPDDAAWLEETLRREPGSTRLRLRYDDGDTEGHAAAMNRIRVVADGGDDTEGHAISIRFPSRGEADAFRKRLIVTGVLAGTVALGAAGGIGLANMSSGDAAGTGAAQSVSGSAWSQDERQAAAVGTQAAGSSWTQDERPAGAAQDADESIGAPGQAGGAQPE